MKSSSLVNRLLRSFGFLHTANHDRLVGVCLEQNPPPVCFAFPHAADGTSYAMHFEISLGGRITTTILHPQSPFMPWVSPHAYCLTTNGKWSCGLDFRYRRSRVTSNEKDTHQ